MNRVLRRDPLLLPFEALAIAEECSRRLGVAIVRWRRRGCSRAAS